MKRSLGVAALVLTALTLAGCTAHSSGSGSGSVADGGPAKQAQGPGVASKADGTVLDPTTQGRSVVTTGTVSLTVAEPVAAATQAQQTVQSAGGHVDSMSEQPASDAQSASATLTLRIPATRLDDVLADLKKLGRVETVSISTQDVTTQVKDVGARITALQTSVDRLLGLMRKATSTADLITIESALSDRQADLDSLKAQQSTLKDQVALATITLKLTAQGTVAATAPGDFWGGLIAGWNALVAAGAVFLVILGVVLPWVLLLAVIAMMVFAIIRLVRHGRRTKEPAAEPPPS
jgi:hypothetical protein